MTVNVTPLKTENSSSFSDDASEMDSETSVVPKSAYVSRKTVFEETELSSDSECPVCRERKTV